MATSTVVAYDPPQSPRVKFNFNSGWKVKVMPDAGLSSNLERGPTPPGAAFATSRKTVRIAGVTAGANAERGDKSFDDDETTDWSNDGQLSSAWIRYEFERAASVGEVTLKLPAWRTRSYPIRITVDDQVVFTGDTPRSLGYVTLAFTPVTGKSLKIELTGSPKEMDAFGKIVELTGQKDVAATGNQNSKGTLGIVEIEIYEPVAGRSIK